MRVKILTLVSLFLLSLHPEVVHAQGAAEDRAVINPLALGGMVQGLLDMQIRPQGGFYEDRYKDIFHDEANVPLATNDFDRRHAANSVRTSSILAEDGKLLTNAASGRNPNPCFDNERLARNRLLFLMCSLQLLNEQTVHNEE